MSTFPNKPGLVDDALARAVVYHALSIGLQAPSDARVDEMAAPGRCAAVAAALQRIASEAQSDEIASTIKRSTSFAMPPSSRLAATFVRLFGHTTRGPICACETEYGADNTYQQPQQLADIAGYYLAFGLQAATSTEVRADHVACECEFMDFMNRKEAFFLTTAADEETLEITRQASRAFLRDHLGRFGRALASRLMVEDPDGLYGMLGSTLFDLLNAECRRLNIASGPVDLVVGPDVTDDAPMACGSTCEAPAELLQIQRRP